MLSTRAGPVRWTGERRPTGRGATAGGSSLGTGGHAAAGRMFWLTRKRFSGSYFAFTDASRCVVLAVGRLDAALGLVVHHEVDVRPFEVERVNRLPVGAPPRLQGVGLLRVGVDPGDDHRPGRVARAPRGRVLRRRGGRRRRSGRGASATARSAPWRPARCACRSPRPAATSRSRPSSTTAGPSGRTGRTAPASPGTASRPSS